jgi:hypothetical protein
MLHNEIAMRLAEKFPLLWTNLLTVTGVVVANTSHQAVTTYLTWASLVVLILLNTTKVVSTLKEWNKKKKEKGEKPMP